MRFWDTIWHVSCKFCLKKNITKKPQTNDQKKTKTEKPTNHHQLQEQTNKKPKQQNKHKLMRQQQYQKKTENYCLLTLYYLDLLSELWLQ